MDEADKDGNKTRVRMMWDDQGNPKVNSGKGRLVKRIETRKTGDMKEEDRDIADNQERLNGEKKRKAMEALDGEVRTRYVPVIQKKKFIPTQWNGKGCIWKHEDKEGDDKKEGKDMVCIHDPIDGKAI